jgi:hypothetical protein
MLSRRTFLGSAIALALAPVLRKLSTPRKHPTVEYAERVIDYPLVWGTSKNATPIEDIQTVQRRAKLRSHGARGTLTWNGKTFKVYDWSIERVW